MRLFISYPRKDKDKTLQLVEILKRGGHEVWIDDQLRVGPQWQGQLRDAIAESDGIVLALTPNWIDSSYCQWEFVTAVELGKKVIPVLLTSGTQLPERISKYQYANFSEGFGNDDQVQRFLNDVLALAVTIDRREVRTLPKSQYEAAINVDNRGSTIGVQNIYGSRTWSIPVVIGLLLILVIAAAVIVSALPEPQRTNLLYSVGMVAASQTPTPTATPTHTPTATFTPSPTSTPTATLTPTPERLNASGFNVVVAGFGYQNADSVVESSTLADDMSDIVAAELNQITQIDYTLGWRSNGVGRILGQTSIEREAQAAQIAAALNADVVIYGLIRSDGVFNIFEPEFYITAEFAAIEPELIGADTLGNPVEVVGNSEDQILAANTFQQRLAVLRFFLRGLAFYLAGNFRDAQASFEEALAVESDGLEVLYIFAGNAALRIPDLDQALTFYNAALRVRPQYTRALVGRGNALYRKAADEAGENPPAYDPDLVLTLDNQCSDVDEELPAEPQRLAELSLRCYQEALRSPDSPETADIDVKVAFSIGQTSLWLSTNGYGDYWDEVLDEFSQVIELYEDSPEERQVRIRATAAHAHASLGLRALSLDGSDALTVCEALNNYRTSVALLRLDINRAYNQRWIDVYGQQAAALEDWLEDRSFDCPAPTD